MSFYDAEDIDHSDEDDSPAFAILTATFTVVVLAVFAFFVFRSLPTGTVADTGTDTAQGAAPVTNP